MNTVSRDDLIAYLLHQLPEAEREALTERWMTDPELYEELRHAEADLFDRYARGTTKPEERRLIEQHLVGSAVQRDKLVFADALAASVPAGSRRRTAWIPLAAAATLVLAAMSAWLFWQNRSLVRERDTLRARSQTTTPDGTVASVFVPLADVRRAAEEVRVRAPRPGSVLRLELEIERSDERARYAATMSTAGRLSWREEPLRPQPRGSGFVVALWIPAEALEPGRYEVSLTADGAPVGYYPIAVVP